MNKKIYGYFARPTRKQTLWLTRLSHGWKTSGFHSCKYHVKELRKIKYKLSKEHVSFKKGKLPPIKKSQPIPAENNKPVKVVVAESLDDIVYKSGKNGEQHLKTFNNTYFDLLTKQKLIKTSIYPPVLIEFYAPSCGHCQVSPILDEVALKLQNDPSVIIAKLVSLYFFFCAAHCCMSNHFLIISY